MSAFQLDKKRSGRGLRFVLLEGIGKPIILDDIPQDWVMESFESLKASG
jgi:3-dehydroquinate synthetase